MKSKNRFKLTIAFVAAFCFAFAFLATAGYGYGVVHSQLPALEVAKAPEDKHFVACPDCGVEHRAGTRCPSCRPKEAARAV